MRILVMGAGVVGVTAAYALLRDGHEVSVVERHPEAAAETSFGNAGMVAPGHAYAWSSPKAPKILLKSLFRDDQAMRFRPSLDPRLWSWSLKFLGQCTAERARVNTLRKHRLCMYSQGALKAIVAETGVAYDGNQGGLLYLHRSQQAFDTAVANMAILTGDGQQLEVADRARVAEIDPALAPVKEQFAGAIYCPTDESGDARLFTQALAGIAAARGVAFHYGTTVRRIESEGDRVTKVATDKGDFAADAFVLSLGCQSPFLAAPLGVDLPIYPIKGYSVTLPVAGRNNPPRIGGVDEQNLVAYCPLGQRLRVTATAELSGYDTSHKPSDFRHMRATIRGLFPEGADHDQPQYWAGLRPMTPQGTPIFGLGRQRNLYMNTGQGHMGWTMAAGSARIVADLIAGRTPEIPLDGMTLQ